LPFSFFRFHGFISLLLMFRLFAISFRRLSFYFHFAIISCRFSLLSFDIIAAALLSYFACF
jgi:hypothetical protein